MQRCKRIFGRASPGSIYPALHQMMEKGLVKREGKKFVLTRRGKKLVERLEREKEAHVRKARQMLYALSELFDDDGLRYVANTIPDWSNFSPALLEVLWDIRNEIIRLGDAALPVLRKALLEMREMES